MRARNPLNEAEQATIDALPIIGSHVMSLSLVGIAQRSGLRGGEVTALPSGELEELPATVTSIVGHQSILQ